MSARVFRAISSWWTMLLLSAALAGIYIFFAYGDAPYPKWIDVVFHTPWGIALYLALAANIALASIRAVREKLGEKTEDVCVMDDYSELVSYTGGMRGMEEWMRRKGFSPVMQGGALVARKGVLTFMPGTVMRAGLVVVMLAALISSNTRQTARIAISEGSEAQLIGKSVILQEVNADLPEDFLQVGEGTILKLNDVSAALEMDGESFTVTSGYPVRHNGLYMRVANIGYYQQMKLGGKRTDAALDILPPGKEQAVRPEGKGDAVTFRLAPEKVLDRGLLSGKQYNLWDPAYEVKVRGESTAFTLRPGETLVAGGYSIRLGERSLYAEVLAAHDPAYPFFAGGLIILLIGFAMMFARLFWYERTIRAKEVDGVVLLGYTEEYYRKWAAYKFKCWVDELVPPAPVRSLVDD